MHGDYIIKNPNVILRKALNIFFSFVNINFGTYKVFRGASSIIIFFLFGVLYFLGALQRLCTSRHCLPGYQKILDSTWQYCQNQCGQAIHGDPTAVFPSK